MSYTKQVDKLEKLLKEENIKLGKRKIQDVVAEMNGLRSRSHMPLKLEKEIESLKSGIETILTQIDSNESDSWEDVEFIASDLRSLLSTKKTKKVKSTRKTKDPYIYYEVYVDLDEESYSNYFRSQYIMTDENQIIKRAVELWHLKPEDISEVSYAKQIDKKTFDQIIKPDTLCECWKCNQFYPREYTSTDNEDGGLDICHNCIDTTISYAPSIMANFNTDDYIFEFEFDCTSWFNQASDEEIDDVEVENLSAGSATDVIYQYYESKNNHKDIIKASDYLSSIQGLKSKKDVCGYSVSVDDKSYDTWKKWLIDQYELLSGNQVVDDNIVASNGSIVSKVKLSTMKNFLENYGE